MSWRVARSLDVLLDEVNTAAPARSKVSDGSIGDAAHATRTSDHNPWITVAGVGVVRARDFTHDPADGLDCNRLAGALVALYGRHPAMGPGSYTIWNRRIYSYDRRSEGWRPYSGSNPHTAHLHQSVGTAAAGFDSTQPWGVFAPPVPEGFTMDQEARAAFDALSRQIGAVSQEVADVREALATFRVKEASRHQTTIKELRGQGKTDREILDALQADEERGAR